MDVDIAYLGLLDDEEIVLNTAALAIATLDHPHVALDDYAAMLSEVTERLVVRGGDARTATEQAGVLAEVFAGEFGFSGDSDTYDDPDNADLIRVIDRRRGLPISLALLYVAAARRLHWHADVLNTPGHVLVRIGPATEPVLIDPFGGGSVVDADRLAALLSQAIGPGSVPTAEHMAPMTSRGALVRLLRNQAIRAEAAGDQARALAVYRRVTLVAPSNGHGWWERARLELAHDDLVDTRASLGAMLEITRDPGVRAHVVAALNAISKARP